MANFLIKLKVESQENGLALIRGSCGTFTWSLGPLGGRAWRMAVRPGVPSVGDLARLDFLVLN